MPAQRESCGDAHIGPMVSEVNRSFLIGLTVAGGPTGAAPVTRLNEQPAGSARSPAAADDIGHQPRPVPVLFPRPLPNTAAQTAEGRVGETVRPGWGPRWNGAATERSQRHIGGRANRMVPRRAFAYPNGWFIGKTRLRAERRVTKMVARTPSSQPAAAAPIAHVPVLLRQAIEHLAPRDGGVYIDGTFGAGGYATAILRAGNARVVGIDRDADAIAAGHA